MALQNISYIHPLTVSKTSTFTGNATCVGFLLGSAAAVTITGADGNARLGAAPAGVIMEVGPLKAIAIGAVTASLAFFQGGTPTVTES